jgi:hypothetical protein
VLKGQHRVYITSPLPTLRVWFNGPRWRRAFGVTSEVLHVPEPSRPLMKRKYLFYDFEPDVRELVTEPIRFDLAAMWADPRERLHVLRP